MNVLFFSPRPYWPLDTGAKLRDYHLARQLARYARVTYLCFSEPDSGDPPPAGFERVVTAQRDPGYTPLKLARGLLGSEPVSVLNYSTAAMRGLLRQTLEETKFDVVQMEGVHLSGYMDVVRSAREVPRVVADWHNIESELMWRYSQMAEGAARRWYARLTARKLEECERRWIAQCDLVCVASERERDALESAGTRTPVAVIPNGVDTAHFGDDRMGGWPHSEDALVYVGSMDYHANVDAVRHFAAESWPPIHAEFPDLRFLIVGRNPGPAVQSLSSLPGVEVTGAVEDVRPYYRRALASVVPLRVGGGTRLKILEAMAAGTPVISTALGAEGLAATPERDYLAAESAEDFVAAVRRVRQDRTLVDRLMRNGRRLAQSQYDWEALGSALYGHYEKLLSAPQGVGERGRVRGLA